MSADPQSLLDKIKALPPLGRAEVADFVDFFRVRERAEAAERRAKNSDRLLMAS